MCIWVSRKMEITLSTFLKAASTCPSVMIEYNSSYSSITFFCRGVSVVFWFGCMFPKLMKSHHTLSNERRRRFFFCLGLPNYGSERSKSSRNWSELTKFLPPPSLNTTSEKRGTRISRTRKEGGQTRRGEPKRGGQKKIAKKRGARTPWSPSKRGAKTSLIRIRQANARARIYCKSG